MNSNSRLNARVRMGLLDEARNRPKVVAQSFTLPYRRLAVGRAGEESHAPGRERSFIPLSRFQLAGWSKDADGVLDLKRVSDIRIGWGGYLGTEGETVQFSVALPQTGTVKAK